MTVRITVHVDLDPEPDRPEPTPVILPFVQVKHPESEQLTWPWAEPKVQLWLRDDRGRFLRHRSHMGRRTA